MGWMLLGQSLALGLRSGRNNHVSVVLVGGGEPWGEVLGKPLMPNGATSLPVRAAHSNHEVFDQQLHLFCIFSLSAATKLILITKRLVGEFVGGI